MEKKEQSVGKYEKSRDRASKLMPLSGDTRKFILGFVFDVSPADMKRSEKIALRVQSQRQETLKLHKEQQKKVPPKKKIVIQKITPVTTSPSVEDPLPRYHKEGPTKSFLRAVARRRLGAYKGLERLS